MWGVILAFGTYMSNSNDFEKVLFWIDLASLAWKALYSVYEFSYYHPVLFWGRSRVFFNFQFKTKPLTLDTYINDVEKFWLNNFNRHRLRKLGLYTPLLFHGLYTTWFWGWINPLFQIYSESHDPLKTIARYTLASTHIYYVSEINWGVRVGPHIENFYHYSLMRCYIKINSYDFDALDVFNPGGCNFLENQFVNRKEYKKYLQYCMDSFDYDYVNNKFGFKLKADMYNKFKFKKEYLDILYKRDELIKESEMNYIIKLKATLKQMAINK